MNKKIDYALLKEDYLPNENDDDLTLSIKRKIQKLTEPEKRIFLLYAELGAYSKVAKIMKCSSPTVHKYIDIIREKLK